MSVWSLVYKGYDPDEEGLREALCTLGNGYFCTRGAAPEVESDGTHYPGTYLAGRYNRLQTEINGQIIENEDLVNMPNWLPLTFRCEGGDWFHPATAKLLSYRQELDLRQGLLSREIRFKDADDRVTRLSSRRLVHMRYPHLAAQEMQITPENWSGTLEIRSALDGRVVNDGVPRYRDLNGRHLEPLDAGLTDEEDIYLLVRTCQSHLRVAQAARTRITGDGREMDGTCRTVEEAGYVARLHRVEVCEGATVTAEKTVILFSSRDQAVSECGLEARKALGRTASFPELLASHALEWEHLWRLFDITFNDGDAPHLDEIRRIVHLHVFHLLQTASINTKSLDLDAGVPSRGWHGEAYRGHVLWDELFVMPFLNLRLPEITRSLLMYRYRRLPEARVAATAAGYRGAMYPWQSGSDGREESQKIHLNPSSGRWIPDNSQLQRHVNSAIVYNIYNYFQATRDMEFLAYYGAEMILEIARFWTSIASYREDIDRYEILGVMGPDEYHEGYPDREEPGLDNNAYTNIMAVWVLKRALEMLDILPENTAVQLKEKLGLDASEIADWREMTSKMRIAFHGDGIISQFEGYDKLQEFDWDGYREKYGDIQRLDRLLEAEDDTPNRYKLSKQADVLMLFYLFPAEELKELFAGLGYAFEHDTIPKNIDYYLKRTSHGSTLSWVVHSWVLVRSDRLQSWDYFKKALHSDIADVQGGTTPEGIHLGAMAGSVDVLQRGYTGLAVRGDVLWLTPCLPEELHTLCMKIRYRGHLILIDISRDRLKVEMPGARDDAINIGCGDETVQLRGGETREFALGECGG